MSATEPPFAFVEFLPFADSSTFPEEERWLANILC
jgi:hypothetical protein